MTDMKAPFSSRAWPPPLKNGTAHSTPGTLLTLATSSSEIGATSPLALGGGGSGVRVLVWSAGIHPRFGMFLFGRASRTGGLNGTSLQGRAHQMRPTQTTNSPRPAPGVFSPYQAACLPETLA